MNKFVNYNLVNDRQNVYYTEEDCREPFYDYNEGVNKYNQCGCKNTERKFGPMSYNSNANCSKILNTTKKLLKQNVKLNNSVGGKIKMCKHHMPYNICKICNKTRKHRKSRKHR